jgi:ubiquinone/menaquinone biosynthesis C-methylase UbiE
VSQIDQGKLAGKLIRQVRTNPGLMGRIMYVLGTQDRFEIEAFFEELADRGNVALRGNKISKGYFENRTEIHRIIKSRVFSMEELRKPTKYMDDRYTQEIYSEGAKIYDSLMDAFWPFGRDEVISWLEIGKGERILEVAVGTGLNLKYYPDEVDLTGIDINQKMLERCREKAKRLNRSFALELMNAQQMDFPNDSFEKVFSTYGLCVISDPLTALKEMKRVCKMHGKIVLFESGKSNIAEVAILQYAFRPIAREMGCIYDEGFPPHNIVYDSYLDVPYFLKKANLIATRVRYFDPFKTVQLWECKQLP